MSTGSSGETITVVLEGPGGTAPCPPGTQQPGQPGPGGGGNAQQPSGFRTRSQANQRSATDAVLGKQLAIIPFLPVASARDLAAGMRIGASAARRGVRPEAAANLAYRQYGPTASAAARGTQSVLGTVGGTALVAGAAGVGAAFIALQATISATNRLYQRHQRALEAVINTVANTGVIRALQTREQVRLQMDREMRALRMAPQLQDILAARTERQMSFDRLSANFNVALENQLRPVADLRADVAELLSNQNWDAILGFISGLATEVAASATGLGGLGKWGNKITNLLGRLADDSRERRKEAAGTALREEWENTLDPYSAANQPFEATDARADFWNVSR